MPYKDPKHRKANMRRAHLRLRYGLTVHDWEKVFNGQEGGCAICRRRFSDMKRWCNPAFVDHDHVTGKVRGLLCDKCNRSIGALEPYMARVVDYINKPTHR